MKSTTAASGLIQKDKKTLRELQSPKTIKSSSVLWDYLHITHSRFCVILSKKNACHQLRSGFSFIFSLKSELADVILSIINEKYLLRVKHDAFDIAISTVFNQNK